MPIPIAVGGKSVSAETLPPPNCREEDSDEGVPLVPVELYQTIGWGVCPCNEWLFRVVVAYYDLMDFNKGARDCTMCELKVQVSLLAKPLSNQYRETVHHLKLVDGARDDYPQFQPQVAVSHDRRNLAILLFHPHQQSSAVVIFQLRKPRLDLAPTTNLPTPSSSIPMPKPPYCNKISSTRQAPAVATNPNFVSVWGISALCCIPDVAPSIFLAVCNDGSLIWLDARSSASIATGALNISQEHLPISSLSVSAERLERGYLLAVSSKTGHCFLAHWKLESSTAIQQTQLQRNSTGDLMVRSHPCANQEGHDVPSKSPTVANSGPGADVPNSSNHDNFNSARVASSQSQKLPARKSINYKEENNQSNVHNRASGKSEAQEGIQNAFKGLKNNRFWNSMATKNIGIPVITGANNHSTTSSTGNNYVHQNRNSQSLGNANGQHINWKSAFHQRNSSSPEKDTKEMLLRKKREKESIEREARQRKSHMNQFVLQELRKKTMAKSWVKHTTGRGSGRRLSLQRRRRRSDGAGVQDDPLNSTMSVDTLSVLQESVVAARFGRMPTVVCVVFRATRRHPQIAQILSISDMGVLQPIVSLQLTTEQVEEATNLQVSNAIVSDDDWDIKNATNTKFGLDLDPNTDTFAISTAFGDQWVGCIWNWRANALGMVVQNEANSALWSRLYFGKDKQTGLKLCYLESSIKNLQIQNHKHLITAGVLSPPRSHGIELEPCPLFLAADFVAFPYVSHETNSGTQQLEWKSSTLPLSYVNAYGAPKMAVAGRHNCSTVAVASSSGVCLLDSKYRWRQFGTPSEESSFSIVAMVWWEGNGTRKSEENEDFLLTIIQLSNGKQYLSCWSPKRLSTRHQLLIPASRGSDEEMKWGIPLLEDVKATSLSLIAEPPSKSKSSPSQRKAVVFVASSDADASELIYATFQLQVSTKLDAESDKKSTSILANKVISGILKDGTRSVGPISSVFLAAASFRFDLENQTSTRAFVATLGVARSPGGLEVISFDGRNRACTSTIVNADEVSKVSLVDIVHGGNRCIDTFVWSVELLNGNVFCWSVPSLLGPVVDEAVEIYSLVSMERDRAFRPSILHPPTLVCKRKSRNNMMRYAMGILSHAGTSSDWMQQSASGCQSDIFMGSIPRSSFGCGLRAGQMMKRTRRVALGGISDDNFAANIKVSEVYSPSGFMITPPAFVPSLYSMFVEIAYRRIRVAGTDKNLSQDSKDDRGRILSLERHIHNRLTNLQNKDAVVKALRLFVLRTIEMVTDVNRRHAKAQTDASSSLVLVATTVFSEVVECIRRCATDLQFASIFLEVGRQMEPSCLPHLFPLPALQNERDAGQLSRANAGSVFDLFELCLQEGSVVTAASALPLLENRAQSRLCCVRLMSSAMEAFIANTSSVGRTYDGTEEERSVIGDIFRFGIKLDDAARFEENLNGADKKLETNMQGVIMPNINEDGNSVDSSVQGENESSFSGSDFSDDSSCASDTRKLLCSSEGQNSVMNVFSMFDRESAEEQEIRKSALSFIGLKSDSVVDFLPVGHNGRTHEEESFQNLYPTSIGGLVGGVLVELIVSPTTDCPWKAMASIAGILTPVDRDQSVAVFSEIAGNLTGLQIDSVIPDLHPDLRAGDVMDRFSEFIVTETGHCGTEINDKDAGLIMHLVLFLLQLLQGEQLREDQSSVIPGLVIVGLVASCVAGSEQQLLSTLNNDCFVSECYKVTAYDC